MERNYIEEDRYLRAEKKVKDIKGFYGHLASYVLVNIFISTVIIMEKMRNGETFSEAFFDFSTFPVWIFWGIGLFFHWLGVFGKGFTFSKDWEDRKIKEFMNNDKFN